RARRAVAPAGYRDRPLRGAPRRRRPTATGQGESQAAHAQERRVCLCGRAEAPQDPAPAARRPRRVARAEARAAELGIAAGPLSPSEACGIAARRGVALRRGSKSGAHQGRRRPLRRSTEGGADARPPPRLDQRSLASSRAAEDAEAGRGFADLFPVSRAQWWSSRLTTSMLAAAWIDGLIRSASPRLSASSMPILS